MAPATMRHASRTPISLMDQFEVRKAILIHPPTSANGGNEGAEASVRGVYALRPDRFFLGVGGNLLNSKIQAGPDTAPILPQVLQEFEEATEGLLDGGPVVVFGEMTAMHLSYETGHPYEVKPANSPLFLQLVEFAAADQVAIDIHIDVVEAGKPTPQYFIDANMNGATNPTVLEENIIAFEAMLDHDPSARIVLAHVGRDTTGDMTPGLIDRLLNAHPNLYISISPARAPLGSVNAIIDENREIRTEWLTVLQDHSERMVMGSDTFFLEEETGLGLSVIGSQAAADPIGPCCAVTLIHIDNGAR
jgi:hypothetical protein